MAIQEVKRQKKIKEAKIESKDQRWHCRNRVTLVFGSNDIEKLDTYIYDKNLAINFVEKDFHQAKSKAIEEILDNCIDEYYRGHVSQINITLSPDKKTVTVQDNGIGFPLNKIEQVYSEFRTGSKFVDDELDSKGFFQRTLGQNGLGAAATCLTSDTFIATVRHHNTKKERTVTFLDGALKTKGSAPKKYTGAAGVKIQVTLSPEVYKDNTIDFDLLRKRIIDLAFNNPGLTFNFNNEKFNFKKGLADMAALVNPKTGQLIGEESFIHEINVKKVTGKGRYDLSISLAYDMKSNDREKFISFVNSTPTYDGGFHHNRLKAIFANLVKNKLARQAKKEKIELIDSDILSGVCFIIGIIMPNPRFESQTKRKLVRDTYLEKSIETLLENNINKFFRKNPDFLEAILSRAKSRQKFQQFKEAAKISKNQSKSKIDKLMDANERKDRSKCTLFICEGDSAIGGLRSGRDAETQGGIALKGKPMNVSQSNIKDILQNKELIDIMGSIGLTIGEKAVLENLRYTRIVFLADSDVDGGHINTLLANFFFKFWPELFELGAICMSKAPLFEIISSTGNKYFADSENELEKIKENKSINIKEIQRNKGLGEMSADAWRHTLNSDHTILSAEDMEGSVEMFEICFGKDSQARKDLLLSTATPPKAKNKNKSKNTTPRRK